MGALSPPPPPATRRVLQAAVALMAAAAALALLLAPLRRQLATVAISAAVAGPFLRLVLVAGGWRTRPDRVYLAGAAALVLTVVLLALLR